MEFTFETAYDQKALTAMAKALRKTVRKKHSRRSHILGWIVFVLALPLCFFSGDAGFSVTAGKVVTWLATLFILIALVFEDQLNGYFAGKRLLKGTEKPRSTFTAQSFVSETEIGTTEFAYDKILFVVETGNYFVFVFSASHAQVYDKNNLSGGTAKDFRKFITEATGKDVIAIR